MISDSQEIVNYVNYQLNSLGFPLLTKQDNLKIVYNLLLVLEKESSYSTTVQQELSLKNKNLIKVEEEVVSLKKKYSCLQENYGKLQQKIKDLQDYRDSDKLEAGKVKEEVVSLKKSLLSLKTLHVHEIRGKSNQIESLKQVINKKMNSLKNEIRENYYKKFEKSDVKKEEELDFLFSSYKEREEELIRENVGVKEFFMNVLRYMKEEYEIQVDLPTNAKLKNIKEMPLDMLKENIKSKLENVKIHKQAESTEDLEMKKQLEEKTREAEKLKKQLEESNEILELLVKQEKNLKKDREMDFKVDEIEIQRKELENARMLLDQERKQFTEAAVRMGMERAQLQKEKEALEENKRQVETEELLKTMPTTPFWMKKSIPMNMNSGANTPNTGPLTKSTPLQESTQDLIDTLSKLEVSEFVMESDTIQMDTPCQNRTRGILKSCKKPSPGSEPKCVRIKEETD